MRTRRHHLKTYPDNFEMMHREEKMFDVRIDDRLFERGDEIVFQEWDPDMERMTGRILQRIVTCKQVWEGLQPGYCALGLRLPPTQQEIQEQSDGN